MTQTTREAVERFGNRRVPKMLAQINAVRDLIAAEGSPRLQDAWAQVEEHIDFAYQQAGLRDRAEAAEARVAELEAALTAARNFYQVTHIHAAIDAALVQKED